MSATERWVFVRHAESVANREGWFSGWTDVALTDRGREQAASARDVLRSIPFDRAFSSDLRRAKETAEIVLAPRGALPELVRALRERDLGEWTGRRHEELAADGSKVALQGFGFRPPGGESLADIAARSIRWMADLPPASSTLIVSHGGLMRAVLGVLDGVPRDEIGLWDVPNAKPQVRELAPGTWAEIGRRLLA